MAIVRMCWPIMTPLT